MPWASASSGTIKKPTRMAWAHVPEGGNPHSHGASWAINGTARGVTEMTERGQP
jgi:hypothetical protein